MASSKPSTEFRVIGVALLCCAYSATAQAPEEFSARLMMMPIEVATRARVTGSGSSYAKLEGRRLSVSGSFAGMRGPATVARLHQGPAMGVRGPAVADLEVTPAPEGKFSGELSLTAEQAQSLRKGWCYIQIHSDSAPAGNLWGWLLAK